jgi:class 3 adenylate cyclase/tetratricopeptide (TPR) repeat protein
MRCRACQGENPEGARFCNQCGEALRAGCPSCGAENPPRARFCNECGAALGGAPAARPAESPAPRERDPRDYTPGHLAEKILGQKSALEGERKQVTVLFADVKGSLDMQEALDAEAWHGIMDRFFATLADSVHRFEGTVNQYTGDGIMALFGAPIAHEDHAQRACYAALHMSEALREYARELRREQGLDFSTRIGLNSGEVVVGKIGDDLRMDYTAQGHTVGLAARMEGLAEPGTIYLTGATAELAAGYFELEDLGAFKVKGVSELVPVSALVGVGQLRTRFDVSRARGLSRFVGRDADMQVLESAFEISREGNGRAVGVVAPAGVGKSRLCFEFAERLRREGALVLVGHCFAHGQNIPLLPVLEIFRAYFGLADGEEPRTAREKIAGRLLLIDEQFRDVLPIMFDFLGVPDPERRAPNMDPEARQRRIIAVVRKLIERGNPDGFLILIEDLHWADPASDSFFAQWVDAIAHGAGLILLNFRPEYRADWMQKSWYQQIPLNPLGPDAIRELLGDLIGSDPSVTGLADRIHARSQGNPYFTEEIVRSLVDSGVLRGSRGRYRLTRPVESLQVPGSVHAVLSARIDRLAEREKRLLQAAAVIGREFSEPILAAVTDHAEGDLAQALAALCGSEFIHQQALYPVAEYAFVHPLTQEVALGSQLQEARRRTHAAVARALEAADPDRADENAALLAQHYEKAGEELEAARRHARAAVWMSLRDVRESARHWSRVRDLAAALPEAAQTDETRGLRLIATTQMVVNGFRLGLSEAALEALYEEGRDLAEASGNTRLLLLLRGAYGARLVSLGRVPEAFALARESLSLADAFGEPASRVGARLGASYASTHLGRLDEALLLGDEAAELIADDLEMGRETYGFSHLVWFATIRSLLLAQLGRCEEGLRECTRANRLARDSGIPENLGWARGAVASLADLVGDIAPPGLGDARAATREAVEIAQQLGSTFSRVLALRGLGQACVTAGDSEEASAALGEALALAREQRVALEQESGLLDTLARARLAADPTASRQVAEEAVALSRERGQRISEIGAHLALAGALCAERGPAARGPAQAALDRAEALIAETGARIYEGPVAEARGELARVCGDNAAGEQHLREAQQLYGQCGASGHARRLAEALGA